MKNKEEASFPYDPARVIAARKNKGYSQEELAFAAGLSLRTIQRIEKGSVHPRLYSLKALADTLGCALSHFKQTTEENLSPKGDVVSWMTLSVYTVVILPFLPLLLQAILWHQATELTEAEDRLCRQRLHFQGRWLAGLVLTLLAQPFVSLLLTGQVSNGNFPLPGLLYLIFIAGNLSTVFLREDGTNAD